MMPGEGRGEAYAHYIESRDHELLEWKQQEDRHTRSKSMYEKKEGKKAMIYNQWADQ